MAAVLRFSGLPRLVRTVHARRKVTIILYHDPAPGVFEKHLKYLSRRYRFIGMHDLAAAFERGDGSLIPPRSLIVTFDDGHQGNHALLPLFRKYRLRPTIFLVSRVVDTRRHFWFKHPGVKTSDYKPHPNARRLELLDLRTGFSQTAEYADSRHALSAAEIAEMSDAVDFEAHTCFHPVLPACDDDEARREIQDSRTDLEALLGRPVRCFSYPNGDYGEREVRLVREAGYTLARTIDVGWTDLRSDPFRLKITGVTDDASISVLAAQLSGITMYLRYRLGGGRGGHWPQVKIQRAVP